MFQTTVLASGSKGNSILIRTEKTKILLDAGLSGKKITEAIDSLELTCDKINAIIVSHEHIDHIRGAGIVCRKYKIPLFISEPTWCESQKIIGKVPYGVMHFCNGKDFRIGDIDISPFASSHDVADGSNFIFTKVNDKSRKLAVATDLGFSSRLMLMKFMNSTTIILESNHDVKMLLEGPYPWHLKQRVKGRQGHLSNDQAVGVISQVIHPGLKNLILAHLSEKNNKPDLAESLMKSYLSEIKHDLQLFISLQNKPTPIIDI